MDKHNGQNFYENLRTHSLGNVNVSRSNPDFLIVQNGDVYDNGNNSSGEDYDSLSGEDEPTGYSGTHVRHVPDKGESNIDESNSSFRQLKNDNHGFPANKHKPEHTYVNHLHHWRPEHSRQRSLSKISEASRGSPDFETRDDLYILSNNSNSDSKPEISRHLSISSLTGSDHHIDIFYDAEISNDDKDSETSHESGSAVVNGNFGSSHGAYITKISSSPNLNYGTLVSSDGASESSPIPSETSAFKFPITTSESTFPQTFSSENYYSSAPQETASADARISENKTAAPITILADVSVRNDRSPASDIPLSLRNLAFLTNSEPPLTTANDGFGLAATNPGYLLTNEGKRSNLKKKPLSASSSSAFHAPNHIANGSIDGSSRSLNTLGSKKTIKWGSDTMGSNTPQKEHPAVPLKNAATSHRLPKSTETIVNRDIFRKPTPINSSNLMEHKSSDVPKVEGSDARDNKDFKKDTEATNESDKENVKERFSTRTNSGNISTATKPPIRDAGGNIIVRALRGLKGKISSGSEEKPASSLEETDEDVISMSFVSSGGGMSTPGDVSPKDYLTDVEDTVTSFDEVERREKRVRTNISGASAATTQKHGLTNSVGPDDVFKPQTASTRSTSSRSGFLPEALKNSLVIILSGIYGIILVVLGLVLPLSETFANPEHPYFFEIFYLYLYSMSMTFLLYVYTYLLRKERNFLQTLPKTISRTFSRTFSRSSMRSRPGSIVSEKSGSVTNKPLVRRNSNNSANSYRRRRKFAYHSDTSNHTGSFYLRVGVIGFGIGSMIHSGLSFGHYFEITNLANHCSDAIQAIKPFSHLCFTFVQMYFIFMNSKMCVHKYKTLARFGLIHMSCTNVCVWLRSIVVETIQVIKVDEREKYNAMLHKYEEQNKDSEVEDADELQPVQTFEEYLQEHPHGSLPEVSCTVDSMMGKLVESSSVYLYPCTIQYSLVCACVLYVMWSNVGLGYTPRKSDTPRRSDAPRKSDSASDFETLDSEEENDHDDDDNDHHKMSVDCAASSRGLFLGIFLFVVAVVCVVCFFVLTSDSNHVTVGTLLGHISEELILIVAFIATVIATFQMRRMRYSGKRKVGIEEILTLVSISGLGLYGIWSIIAAVFHLDKLHGRLTLVTNLFMLVQAGSQATFTLATLRASARNHEQLREKPGRQCVTFLLICNFALWVISSFETQRIEYNQTQVHFYGTTAWAIFSHISVPLGIYFRFHSTVNLSIVWKKAWKKKEDQDHLETHQSTST